MASQVEIIQCIDKLKSGYPNYQPDISKTADLWKELFVDVSGETLKSAILACMAESGDFAPSAGTIRGKAQELNARAAGIPDAYQAYDEVCRMPASMESLSVVVENGQNFIEHAPLKFTHPLVETVARLLGWPKDFPTDLPGVDRGQWVRAYDAELSRYMAEAGRHPALTDYIERKRADLEGKAPALLSGLTQQLTKGN